MQVALDAVQYARSGAFSVNLWFKPGNMSGSSMSYLFSHRGTTNSSNATANTGWYPNQIQVWGGGGLGLPAGLRAGGRSAVLGNSCAHRSSKPASPDPPNAHLNHPALASLIPCYPATLPASPPPSQLYLPNEEHPSYGVVRTYVKDYDDVPATMGAATWLDSGAWRLGASGRVPGWEVDVMAWLNLA